MNISEKPEPAVSILERFSKLGISIYNSEVPDTPDRKITRSQLRLRRWRSKLTDRIRENQGQEQEHVIKRSCDITLTGLVTIGIEINEI